MSDCSLYLGFDFSTQQLKVIAITESLQILCEESILFDEHLSEFKTQGGVHRYPEEPLRVTAPPLMWVSALDKILERLKSSHFPFDRVACVSGAGQQHGSVYWSEVGEGLLQRLDPGVSLRDNLADAFIDAILGEVHPYFHSRYGFNKNCKVLSFTGDNPSSLAGLPACPGDIVISLGTSDTLFLSLAAPVPSLMGHVFVSPLDSGSYMGLLCYKNASLARERIRDSCAEGSWDRFNSMIDMTPPGNGGIIGMYFFDAEITPGLQGVYLFDGASNPITEVSPEQQVRAILEGQLLAKRLHSSSLGYLTSPGNRVLATGGASNNPHILQMIADVFDCRVCVVDSTSNSACLGAAIRALFCTNSKITTSYPNLVEQAVKCSFATKPRSEFVPIYREMLVRYQQLEESLMKEKYK